MEALAKEDQRFSFQHFKENAILKDAKVAAPQLDRSRHMSGWVLVCYFWMTVQYRWPLGMPLVRNLGSALWEICSALQNRIARTLFFVHEGEIVLLHGFIKKTRKTPTEDRALALQRKNAYLKTS